MTTRVVGCACFGVLSKLAALNGVDVEAMLFVRSVVGAVYRLLRLGCVPVTVTTRRYAVASGVARHGCSCCDVPGADFQKRPLSNGAIGILSIY
jgi:hypothetical protein